MIPFDHLGPVFKRFASLVYPQRFRNDLASLSRRMERGGHVLDAGGGTGVLSAFLYAQRKDLTFVLLDPAHGMLRHAPAFAVRTVGVAESMPFPGHFFEAVMIGDAFHHCDDPDRAAEEMRRVLKPGGVLVVFEIDPEKALGRFIARAERALGEPAHFFAPGVLSARLAEAGFACTVSRYAWRYAVWCTAPRRAG